MIYSSVLQTTQVVYQPITHRNLWSIAFLYNNQINAHALIGQSAMVYCAGKPTEKSRVLWIII